METPLIISKYNGALTNLCWRDCKQIGDHTHIFWDCPKLKSFWEGIRTEILAIWHINSPLDARYYILGVIPEGAMDKTKGYLLHILLLVARKMITTSWLKPLLPTLRQWRDRLLMVFSMEKITARLQMKSDVFVNRWTPVIHHFGLQL